MGKLDPAWLKALADLFINLSAGWFGAVIIVPNFWPPTKFANFLFLTYDLIAGILFLVVAIRLRKLSEK